MQKNSTEHPNYDTLTYYYNPTTNEIRWAIDGLEKDADPFAVNRKNINLQLICKVNGPNIVLSGETQAVENIVPVNSKDWSIIPYIIFWK